MRRILVGMAFALTLFALASVHGTARARLPFTGTLIAHVSSASTNTNNVTTSPDIDTSGANLIVVCVHNYVNVPTLSDSKSNSPWVGLTQSGLGTDVTIYYFYNPTVGSGHNFTLSATSSYPAITVTAFSGAVTSPFDQENGGTAAISSTVSTGSVTPSEDNEILVACATPTTEDVSSVNSGFTLIEHGPNVSSNNVSYGMAYEIQTSATARNPQFTMTGVENASSAAIATFKTVAGGGPTGQRGLLNNPVGKGGGTRIW